MSKLSFIIPDLRSIEIKSYNLFNSNWKYEIKNGLNLFLGVNAIGKTTTMKLIIFGFVGEYIDISEGEINSNYFLERMEESNESSPPTIILNFFLGDQEILLYRDISTASIYKLFINGEPFASDDLDEIYEGIIEEYGNIQEKNDLTYLLQYLLIREEEDNYLLWDQHSQSKVFRIIGGDYGLDLRYQQLVNVELQKADSAYKRKTDEIKPVKERIKALKNSKEDYLSKAGDNIVDDLKSEISLLEKDIDNAEKEYKNAIEIYNALTYKLEISENEFNEIKFQHSEKKNEYQTLSQDFYKDSFNPKEFRYDIIKDTLKHNETCIICNTNLGHNKAKEVLELTNNYQCPLCTSEVYTQTKSNTPEDIQRLNDLTIDIDKLSELLKSYEVNIANIRKEVSENSLSLLELKNKINELKFTLSYKQKFLSQNQNADSETYTEFDIMIRGYQEEEDKLSKESAFLLAKKKEKVKEAELLNKEINDQIDSFKNILEEIFINYSSIYFKKTDADLVLRGDKNPKGLEIPLSYFIPRLKGKERYYRTKVSTSEANILEYIFRISILQTYQRTTKNNPTIILETSEGSFDIDKTIRLAKTIKKFSNQNFPVTIVANLSKEDFIEEILDSNPSTRKKQTFQILNYTNLDDEASITINKKLKSLNLVD